MEGNWEFFNTIINFLMAIASLIAVNQTRKIIVESKKEAKINLEIQKETLEKIQKENKYNSLPDLRLVIPKNVILNPWDLERAGDTSLASAGFDDLSFKIKNVGNFPAYDVGVNFTWFLESRPSIGYYLDNLEVSNEIKFHAINHKIEDELLHDSTSTSLSSLIQFDKPISFITNVGQAFALKLLHFSKENPEKKGIVGDSFRISLSWEDSRREINFHWNYYLSFQAMQIEEGTYQVDCIIEDIEIEEYE